MTALATLAAAAALPLGYAPAWTSDGARVAYVAGGDVWVADADGTHRTLLVRQAADPAWAADARSLAFVRDGAVWWVRADGLGQRRLGAGANPAWTPWGDVSFDRGGEIFAVAPTGGRAEHLASGTQPVWGPGGGLALVAGDVVVLDGVPVGTGSAPAWTADGRLAYRTRSGAVVVVRGGPPVWRPRPAPDRELLPDFDQRAPAALVIAGGGRHWRLGFTSLVDNVGTGPAIITGVRPAGAARMIATQRVLLANGAVRTYADVARLRYTNSAPHHHWHIMRFDSFELRDVAGRVVVRDRKQGFCLADHYALAPGHYPGRRAHYFGNCEQFHPHATFVLQGTSIGFTDRYPGFFHGQNVDLTGVPAGTYVLVHRVNANLGLHELRYDNDAASVRIRLSWRSGIPSVRVLRTCQSTATC